MRSDYLEHDYWPAMCERIFEGLNMEELGLPAVNRTTYDQGGWSTQATNTFFANGVEDPWKWATMLKAWPDKSLNQVAVTSDCDNCAHCVELYTPTREDAAELNITRWKIYYWIHKLFNFG